MKLGKLFVRLAVLTALTISLANCASLVRAIYCDPTIGATFGLSFCKELDEGKFDCTYFPTGQQYTIDSDFNPKDWSLVPDEELLSMLSQIESLCETRRVRCRKKDLEGIKARIKLLENN